MFGFRWQSYLSADVLLNAAFDLKAREMSTKRCQLAKKIEQYNESIDQAMADNRFFRSKFSTADDLRRTMTQKMDCVVADQLFFNDGEFDSATFAATDEAFRYHTMSKEFKRSVAQYNSSCVVLKELHRLRQDKQDDLHTMDLALMELRRLQRCTLHVDRTRHMHPRDTTLDVIVEPNCVPPSGPPPSLGHRPLPTAMVVGDEVGAGTGNGDDRPHLNYSAEI